jgi:RecA-family ATPase
MLHGWMAAGTVAMLSGDGGQGKSLIAQQLCTSAVLGRLFFGLACKPGRALYLTAEDDAEELWRRQRDICRMMGTTMADLDDAGLRLAPRIGRNNALATLDRKDWRMVHTDFLARNCRRCLDEGINWVVIDTATQTFSGNQNDEQQVIQFCNILRRWAVLMRGVILLIKHPSVAGRALGTGESGSVAWQNSVRARMYLHKNKDGGLGLELMKSNYSKAGERLPVRWEKGCFVQDIPAASAHYGYRDD